MRSPCKSSRCIKKLLRLNLSCQKYRRTCFRRGKNWKLPCGSAIDSKRNWQDCGRSYDGAMPTRSNSKLIPRDRFLSYRDPWMRLIADKCSERMH